jgi:hypothetical protein
MSKSYDISFGENNEITVFNQLKDKFDTLKKTKKYDEFDYETATLKIELKSRRCNHDKYPTTMIGLNKIKKCEDPNMRYLFIFKFEDKTLWCEYDVNVFENFEVKQGGRCDRGKVEVTNYCYIPISYLNDLNSL